MRTLTSEVLADPTYVVPPPVPAAEGLGWLRGAVVRFAEGDVRRRRRALVEAVIGGIGTLHPEGSPTRSLLGALGLPADLDADVAAVAACYQPHAPQSAAADVAADRLVAACGGRSEEGAAIVCVLVQAHAATAALVEARRTGSTAAPVASTRRVVPGGEEVVVDLADAHFGRGPHRCPGEDLAGRLADLSPPR